MKKSSNIVALFTGLVLLCTGPMVWGHGVGRQPEGKGEVGRKPANIESPAVEERLATPEAGVVEAKVPQHGKGSQQAMQKPEAKDGPSSGESASKIKTEPIEKATERGGQSEKKELKDIAKRENSDTLYFGLGFLLGFVGVIVAYFMSNHDKRAVKWSAIGMGVSILLGVLAFVAILGIASAPLSAL